MQRVRHLAGALFCVMGFIEKGFSYCLLALSIMAFWLVITVLREVVFTGWQLMAMVMLAIISLFFCFASGVLIKEMHKNA